MSYRSDNPGGYVARASTNPSIMPDRSLAAVLADLDDERLLALLTARPDLIQSRPATFEQLAARASTWPSVLACFDTLDQTHRSLLEAMCLVPIPTCTHQLASFLDPALGAGDLAVPLRRLEELALVLVEDGHHIWISPAFKQLRYPAGLGPPAESVLGGFPAAYLAEAARRLGVAPERTKGALLRSLATAFSDPVTVRRAVDAGPPGTAELAGRLAAGPPVVAASGSYYNASDRTPHGWLANRGLLAHPGWGEAFMPGEVGLALRDNVMFPGFSLHRPSPATTAVDPADIDAAAADAALRLISDLAAMIGEWDAAAPKVLKSGGLGVRDVRRAAVAAGRSEADAARIIELAVAAGLAGSDRAGAIVLPTPRFDQWLTFDPGARWATVVETWLLAGHHLSAALDAAAGGGAARPLLPRFWSRAPAQRRAVLDAFAELAPGRAADRRDLADAATWPRPALWGGSRAGSANDVRAVIIETELLGLGAAGSLSTSGRLAVGGRLAEAGRALADLTPAIVSVFTVQADLTAVAAGTLSAPVRAELDLLADVESSGAATVFRFSPSSLVRAFEAGRTSEQITAWLAGHARNEVPQPLSYLIGDLGRRYGRLRIGAAGTYLRSEDPSLTAEVLAARASSSLALRELAPGVLVSPAKPAKVMTVLRAAGYLSALEDAGGTLMICRPAPPRAPNPAAAGPAPGIPRPAPPVTDARAVVASMRRAEPAGPVGPIGRVGPSAGPTAGPSLPPRPGRRPTGIEKSTRGIRELLTQALDEDWAVRLEYLTGTGPGHQLTVVPTELDGGRLTVETAPHWNRDTLAVDRIGWARVLTEAEEDAL